MKKTDILRILENITFFWQIEKSKDLMLKIDKREISFEKVNRQKN